MGRPFSVQPSDCQAIELVDGVIVLIDYGGTTEELEPRHQLGTLRTYRGHHLGPDPLLEPGRPT